MSKVLLSGYYGFGNFGDEAILQVLINNLKNINADITVLSHNPAQTTQQHDVKAVFMFNLFSVLSNINQTDVLISGGGSLLQDVTSIKSLVYYLFIIFWSVLCGKRVIIFAQGIGPIKNKFLKSLTKRVLQKVHYITVRDTRSKNLLESWNIKSTLVNDPVWGIKLKTTPPRNRIGIQLREWKYMNDEFFLNLVKKIAKNFYDKEIIIYSLHDKQDKEKCLLFEYYLHIENPKVKTRVVSGMDAKEIIENMKGLEYLVAMRYHAIMIGLKYGTKTLAINYDPKVETLANFAKIPCINFEEYNDFDKYFEEMKNLSRRSILLSANKKKFSFEQFEEEINKA